MLQLTPQGWFGWNFDVLHDGNKIAEIKTSILPEGGSFSIDGASYRIWREGMFSGEFLLDRDGQTVARAQKPSAFRSLFEITHLDRSYTLKKESLLSRSFVLLEGDVAVGSIRSEGRLSRKATVSLPEAMPAPVQLFVIWLVILLWKRESDAANTAAVSAATS